MIDSPGPWLDAWLVGHPPAGVLVSITHLRFGPSELLCHLIFQVLHKKERERERIVITWLVAHVVGRLAGEMTWHCLLGWVALLLRCVRAGTPSSWNRPPDRSSSWESRRTEREIEEDGAKREGQRDAEGKRERERERGTE